MQHIDKRIESQIAAAEEKFGSSSLKSTIEYVQRGLVFESNHRQYMMVSAACSQIALAAATEQFDLIDGVIAKWVGKIDARHEASQLELDYTGELYALHENRGYKSGRDKLHSTPHVGLFHFRYEDNNGEKQEHTIRAASELVKWFEVEMTTEHCHWMALGSLISRMEGDLNKFLDTADARATGYVLPKTPERNKMGNMKWSPVLRAFFWVSLAAKAHLEPEDEGRHSYAQFCRNRLNKVERDIAAMDDQALEPGHYLLVARDEAEAAVEDIEFKEQFIELHRSMWEHLRKFNAIAKWGEQFWDGAPIQITEYPDNSGQAARDFEAVLALMGRHKKQKEAAESLYQKLVAKAAA